MPGKSEIFAGLSGLAVGLATMHLLNSEKQQQSGKSNKKVSFRDSSGKKSKDKGEGRSEDSTTGNGSTTSKMTRGGVVYEVNIDVAKDIEDKFQSWLKEHIEELLSLPGFLSAEWMEEEEPFIPTVVFAVGDMAAVSKTCQDLPTVSHIRVLPLMQAEEEARLTVTKGEEDLNQPLSSQRLVELLRKSISSRVAGKKSKIVVLENFPRNEEDLRVWRTVAGSSVKTSFAVEIGQVTNEGLRNSLRDHEGTIEIPSSMSLSDIAKKLTDKVEEQSPTVEKDEPIKYTVQYRLKNEESMDRYLNEYAPQMRGKAPTSFQGKMSVTRRIFTHREEFHANSSSN